MFGKLQNFAVRKLLESKLKDVPEDQKALIMTLVEKDPELFKKIAQELDEEMKRNGGNQMQAAMKVLPKYQAQIVQMMPQEMKEKLMREQMKMQGAVARTFNPNGTIRR